VHELDVQLVRAARGEAALRRERSPLNYIVGGALLVGAIPLLAISLVALARNGDCVEESGGACTERSRSRCARTRATPVCRSMPGSNL
jgi:hypothetical protein